MGAYLRGRKDEVILKFIQQNMAWLIPLAITLVTLCGFGFILLKNKIKDYWIESEAASTRAYIHENALKYLITYIVAPPGGGKTTLACGLVNLLSARNQELAFFRLKNLTLIHYDLDFSAINNRIEAGFMNNLAEKELSSQLLEEFPKLSRKYDSKKELVSGSTLLHSYVDASYALQRDNYVLASNVDFTSALNGRASLTYNSEMINLKDRLVQKDFSIPRYSIIFDDEKENSASKGCHDVFTHVKEDAGSEIFFRLIRQIGEETIFYITTDQSFDASIKIERRLATSIPYVLNLKKYQSKNQSYRWLCFLEKHYERIYNRRLKKSGGNVIFSIDRVREKLFRLMQRKKEQALDCYYRIETVVYHSSEDVGKKTRSTIFHSEKVDFTFHNTICHSFNTMSHSYLYDELKNSALPDMNRMSSKENTMQKAQNLLKKKELRKKPDQPEKEKSAKEFDDLKRRKAFGSED